MVSKHGQPTVRAVVAQQGHPPRGICRIGGHGSTLEKKQTAGNNTNSSRLPFFRIYQVSPAATQVGRRRASLIIARQQAHDSSAALWRDDGWEWGSVVWCSAAPGSQHHAGTPCRGTCRALPQHANTEAPGATTPLINHPSIQADPIRWLQRVCAAEGGTQAGSGVCAALSPARPEAAEQQQPRVTR